MKTLSKVPMELVNVETIPENLEFGKFYYSEKYKTARHLCPCGCGKEFSIPIKEGEWNIVDKEKLTVVPSLHHRIYCQSHYIIKDGFANIVNNPIPKNNDGTFGFQYPTHAPGGCPM